MNKSLVICSVLFTCILANTQLLANSNDSHSMHNHAAMVTSVNEAIGMGMVHNVNVSKNMVKLTHEPIPSLSWPKMTMDLPVTKRVDLSTFKAGDKVRFTLKKGRDNQYRIVAMEPAMLDEHHDH